MALLKEVNQARTASEVITAPKQDASTCRVGVPSFVGEPALRINRPDLREEPGVFLGFLSTANEDSNTPSPKPRSALRYRARL